MRSDSLATGVPRSVDNGIAASLGEALAVNLALLGLFAVQHSVMARPGFKRRWTRFVAPSVERSTYMLIASGVLFVVFWQWRTMPAVVWEVTSPIGRAAVWALFWLGWVTAFATTFMISYFELFGLRQAYLAWRRKPQIDPGFRTPLLYRLIRHPLMVGFPDRILVGADYDRRASAVRGRDHRLHPDCRATRGARPRRVARHALP